ncbi:MAG: hypothetical protein IPL01_19855 [Acidobacteria bacterium]|nr:hypothetical protein [Acidobacteriota bacterium]
MFRFEEAQPPPAAPAPKAAKTPALGRIEFNGLRRFDLSNAIQVSGLTTGNPVNQAQFNEATRRLLNSGFFSEVNYSLSQDGDRINALFAVIENRWNATCRFDNFIWFTQQEMYDAIRREIPLFDGTVPDNIVIAKRIASVLDQMLLQRGIERKPNIADESTFGKPAAPPSVRRGRPTHADLCRELSRRLARIRKTIAVQSQKPPRHGLFLLQLQDFYLELDCTVLSAEGLCPRQFR